MQAKTDQQSSPDVASNVVYLDCRRLIVGRKIAVVNNRLSQLAVVASGIVTDKKLVNHALSQVGSLLQSPVVELWRYDWNKMQATPTNALTSDGSVECPVAHPALAGIPLPQSLIDANNSSRLRPQFHALSLAAQPDVGQDLVDYYQRHWSCDRFVHLPIVEGDQITGAVIAFYDRSNPLDGPKVGIAHAVVNRLTTNLSVLKRVAVVATSEEDTCEVQKKSATTETDDHRAHWDAAHTSRDLDINDTDLASEGMNQNEKEIFLSVIELPVGERDDFIVDACQGDLNMEDEIRQLISVHCKDEGVLLGLDFGELLVGELTTSQPRNTGASDRDIVGRYRLREEIGRGASAIVYKGIQTEPIHRVVAVKVLNTIDDQDDVSARFRTEQQVQALMDHPNIARVLDAGSIESGRPFLAMEFVSGPSIKSYCEQHHLPIEARLQLVLQACRAVQHSHQKGVVHRDLKPSNILVTIVDGHPLVKLIDFGVARTLAAEADGWSGMECTQIRGTPTYMAPEQLSSSNQVVDTRSDIYSLGVILYQLLTWELPIDPDDCRGLHQDRSPTATIPILPSVRVSNGAEIGNQSEMTIGEVKRWARSLVGDLDRIAMKCLERDPNCRYSSVSELVADIQRHLHDEPITVAPPTPWYCLTKFAKRNRWIVLTAMSITAAFAIGIIGASLLALVF